MTGWAGGAARPCSCTARRPAQTSLASRATPLTITIGRQGRKLDSETAEEEKGERREEKKDKEDGEKEDQEEVSPTAMFAAAGVQRPRAAVGPGRRASRG